MEIDQYKARCDVVIPTEGRFTAPRLPLPPLEPERDPLRGKVSSVFLITESIQMTREDLYLNTTVEILESEEIPLTEDPRRGDRLMILHVMAIEWNGDSEVFVAPDHADLIKTLFPRVTPLDADGDLLRLSGISSREIRVVRGFDEMAARLYKPFFSDEISCYSVIKRETHGMVSDDWMPGAFNHRRQRRLKYRFQGRSGWFDDVCERFVVSEYLRKLDLPTNDEMIDRVLNRLK